MLNFDNYTIPHYTRESLTRYIEQGVPPGDFLLAILTNDLFGAYQKADDFNRAYIYDICKFIYNEFPSIAWRSKENILRWIEGKSKEREVINDGLH